jgi:peroxiredoxin Q/BCP
MARLEPGQTAPDFTLSADDGTEISLSGLAGRRVVLFFYPKADTPGCTTEACEVRDAAAAFGAAGAQLLGISPDTVAKQSKFSAKHGFPYPLLADPEHEIAEAYGVWVEKSMYGKTYMGVERSTFVIGPDGTIEAAHYKVKPKGHATAVLEGLAAA